MLSTVSRYRPGAINNRRSRYRAVSPVGAFRVPSGAVAKPAVIRVYPRIIGRDFVGRDETGIRLDRPGENRFGRYFENVLYSFRELCFERIECLSDLARTIRYHDVPRRFSTASLHRNGRPDNTVRSFIVYFLRTIA